MYFILFLNSAIKNLTLTLPRPLTLTLNLTSLFFVFLTASYSYTLLNTIPLPFSDQPTLYYIRPLPCTIGLPTLYSRLTYPALQGYLPGTSRYCASDSMTDDTRHLASRGTSSFFRRPLGLLKPTARFRQFWADLPSIRLWGPSRSMNRGLYTRPGRQNRLRATVVVACRRPRHPSRAPP